MQCHVCGNEYDRCFELKLEGRTYAFDCFECAIHALAPTCEHCECRIIGHGVQVGEAFYCCASCARMDGRNGVQDRVERRAHA